MVWEYESKKVDTLRLAVLQRVPVSMLTGHLAHGWSRTQGSSCFQHIWWLFSQLIVHIMWQKNICCFISCSMIYFSVLQITLFTATFFCYLGNIRILWDHNHILGSYLCSQQQLKMFLCILDINILLHAEMNICTWVYLSSNVVILYKLLIEFIENALYPHMYHYLDIKWLILRDEGWRKIRAAERFSIFSARTAWLFSKNCNQWAGIRVIISKLYEYPNLLIVLPRDSRPWFVLYTSINNNTRRAGNASRTPNLSISAMSIILVQERGVQRSVRAV